MRKTGLALLAMALLGLGFFGYSRYTNSGSENITVGILSDAAYYAEIKGKSAVGIEPVILEEIVTLINKDIEISNKGITENKSKTELVSDVKLENKTTKEVPCHTNCKTKCISKQKKIKYESYNSIESLTQAVKSNKIAIGAGALTIRKSEDVRFSNGFEKVNQVILTNIKSNLNSLISLKGKKIGTQLGSTCESFIKNEIAIKKLEIAVTSTPDITTLVEMLKENKIDAIIIDNTLAKDIISKIGNIFVMFDIKESKTEEYGFMLSKEINLDDFNKKLSEVLIKQKSKDLKSTNSTKTSEKTINTKK